MEPWLAWGVLGLVLVIAELLTGTFYLLVLGVAAFGAAAVAGLGHVFAAQAIVACVVAAGGFYGVHRYRHNHRQGQMPPLDAGMAASFVAWLPSSVLPAHPRCRVA